MQQSAEPAAGAAYWATPPGPAPPAPASIEVVVWKGPKAKARHTVPNVFADDPVLHGLAKIRDFLKEEHIPYAFRGEPLRFHITDAPKWYRANPFLAAPSAVGTPAIVYQTGNVQIGDGPINVVFPGDMPFAPGTPARGYYVPEEPAVLDPKAPSAGVVAAETAGLAKLWSQPAPRPNNRPGYSQVAFRSVMLKGATGRPFALAYDLEDVFSATSTQEDMPMLQYIDDPSRVMYKLYAQHSIPDKLLERWSTPERLPRIRGLFIVFNLDHGRFAPVFLTGKGSIHARLSLGGRHIGWEMLLATMAHIRGRLEKVLRMPVSIDVHSLGLEAIMDMRGPAAKFVGQQAAQIPALFEYNSIQGNGSVARLIYRRSVAYHRSMDAATFIQGLLAHGQSETEIIEALMEQGRTAEEAQALFQEWRDLRAMTAVSAPKRRDAGKAAARAFLEEAGAIVDVKSDTSRTILSFDNLQGFPEAWRALVWTRAFLWSIASKGYQEVATPLSKPVAEEEEELLWNPDQTAGPSTAPPAKSSSSADGYFNSSTEEDSAGGGSKMTFKDMKTQEALGVIPNGKRQNDFATALQEAEPKIFKEGRIKGETFSRKCPGSATDMRQPAVLTKEQFDRMGYTGYNSFVEFGTDPNKKNVYFCPHIWCPVDKVALTEDEYNGLGKKCPNGDSAIRVKDANYWKGNADNMHIGFLENRTDETKFCVPCCFKKLQTQKADECPAPRPRTSKRSDEAGPSKPAETDQHYILHQPHLKPGRAGDVPRELHNLIIPGTPYHGCYNALRREECLVRQGMLPSSDQMMDAIAYALGYHQDARAQAQAQTGTRARAPKELLIRDIRERLDPRMFLALEDGLVAEAFAPRVGIAANSAKAWSAWERWAARYPGFAECVGAGAGAGTGTGTRARLSTRAPALSLAARSRLLAIQHAHEAFLTYLASNESKEPAYLISLFANLGVGLVFMEHKWTHKPDSQSELYVRCPASVDGRARVLDPGLPLAVILAEDGWYEPVELRRSKQGPGGAGGITRLAGARAEKVREVLSQCPVPQDGAEDAPSLAESLRGLNNWVSQMLRDYEYQIDTAIVDPDLLVRALRGRAGFWVGLPTAVSLRAVIGGDSPIRYMVFHEDLMDGPPIRYTVMSDSAQNFEARARAVGLTVVWGETQPPLATNGTRAVIDCTLPVAPLPTGVLPVFAVEGESPALRAYLDRMDKTTRRRNDLARAVAKVLLQTPESELAAHNGKVADLLPKEIGQDAATAKDLKYVLESVPLSQGHRAIRAWSRAWGLMSSMQYLASGVIENGGTQQQPHEWVFSQVAVQEGLPRNVLFPVHGARPNPERPFQVRNQDGTLPATGSTSRTQSTSADVELPRMATGGKLRELPSKWWQIKTTYSWKDYREIYRKDTYSKTDLPGLLAYLGEVLHRPVGWTDVVDLRRAMLSRAILHRSEAAIVEAFEDPGLRAAWAAAGQLSFRSGRDAWERGFEKATDEARRKMVDVWERVSRGDMWPMVLDVYHMAKLLDMTILVIEHRSATQKDGNAGKRGDLQDLAVSSHLFLPDDRANISTRPFMMMVRSKEKDHDQFGLVTPTPDAPKPQVFWKRLKDTSKDIIALINEHQQRKDVPLTLAVGPSDAAAPPVARGRGRAEPAVPPAEAPTAQRTRPRAPKKTVAVAPPVEPAEPGVPPVEAPNATRTSPTAPRKTAAVAPPPTEPPAEATNAQRSRPPAPRKTVAVAPAAAVPPTGPREKPPAPIRSKPIP